MKKNYLVMLLTIIFMAGCTNADDKSIADTETDSQEVTTFETAVEEAIKNENSKKEGTVTTILEEPVLETAIQPNDERFTRYELIELDGGDLSGTREANIVVDIGYGDREYWAFTNEHGQLVRVVADEISVQDDSSEPVLSSGRYYSDEAKVPGVECL